MDELMNELKKIKAEDIANLPNEIMNSSLPPTQKELALDNYLISMRMLKKIYDKRKNKGV